LLAFFLAKDNEFMSQFACRLIILFGLLIQGCSHDEVIVEGLAQNDANEILLALRENAISAEKKVQSDRRSSSYSIVVKKDEVKTSLKILLEKRLPKTSRAGLKEIYDMGKSGLIPSKSDEEARLTLALQGEIESLIKLMPQVLDARVVLSLDHENYGQKKSDRSASVALLVKNGAHNNDPSLDEIKELVASAVGNMNMNSVYVTIKEIVESIEKPSASFLVASDEHRELSAKNPIFLWVFLAITILAIIVAAYAFIRMGILSKNHALASGFDEAQ
jgi:type III secretion system YscJ/HrcJ family lipoprotein